MNDYWMKVPSETMFDFQDFYARAAAELPDGCRVAECGVANGRSMLYLAAALQAAGKKYRLVAVDSMAYGGQSQRNEIIAHIIASGLPGIELFEMSSLDASCKFPDQYFDLVFIDTAHTFEITKAEVRLWKEKVKDGGILAGHDASDLEVQEALSRSGLHRVVVEQTPRRYGVWHWRRPPS